MRMEPEICCKCRHCLSCFCGDEFDDCYIKNTIIREHEMKKNEKNGRT